MNLNRDEFLLLSRTGRGPYSTRAGPQPFGLPEFDPDASASSRRFGKRGRTGLRLLRGAGSRLRHVLGPRSGRSPRVSRALEYGDEEYFEMEFAVGFPAEEETVL
ncbi:MAG: hypothetical protein WAU75_08950 [Solirubrobacteraceae bacterium]